MLTITKTFDFCASHTLSRPDWEASKNREVFGKCANPAGHGHNYRLEVTLAGPLDPATNMVFDASKLQALVDRLVIDDLDHRNLNVDVPWLKGSIPTSEAIVDAVWNRLAPEISAAAPAVRLKKLVLWETPKIYATREE